MLSRRKRFVVWVPAPSQEAHHEILDLPFLFPWSIYFEIFGPLPLALILQKYMDPHASYQFNIVEIQRGQDLGSGYKWLAGLDGLQGLYGGSKYYVTGQTQTFLPLVKGLAPRLGADGDSINF